MDKGILQQVLDALGVTLAALFASTLGAVGSLAFAEQLNKRQAFVVIVLGVGFGSFGSRAAEAWFQLNPLIAGLTAMIGGVLAVPVLGFVFGVANHLRRRAASVADRGLDKVLGPETKPPAPPPPPAG